MHVYTVFLIFLILLVLLPDYYLYRRFMKHWVTKSTSILHWVISAYFIIVSLTILTNINYVFSPETNFRLIMFVAVLGLVYIPKLAFCTCDLIFFLTKKRWRKIQNTGYVLAAICALTILHGMFFTRFNFEKGVYNVPMKNLPSAFDGYKIVQISDAHLGTFAFSQEKLLPLMDSINAQKPDLIVFTGDLVNTFATECNNWTHVFRQLNPDIPKLAILGNHDYSTYFQDWESEDLKEMNSMAIRQKIRDFGFKLLLDESVVLHRGNDSLVIIGTQNWGKKPETNFCKIEKAMKGTKDIACKIMLTHDPTFWKDSICDARNIDLTLSGHTHAAQMGIKIGNWEWSPAEYGFEQYDGQYERNGNYIIVSRGIGCVAMPVRLGLNPQYSLITLEKKQ